MSNDTEHRFDMAMMSIYHRARTEVNYNATRFLQMLHDHRGVETARILIHSTTVSDGYTALWERRRLDLTVEALILEAQWYELFTEEERNIARRRLEDYGYDLNKG
jgi:hypothetical protein